MPFAGSDDRKILFFHPVSRFVSKDNMLGRRPILIVEDEPLLAMLLAEEVEAMSGIVVATPATVAAALEILEREAVAAAIVDVNLIDRDITPVALRLMERKLPFVVYTGAGLPPDLAAYRESITMVLKPGKPTEKLAELIRAAH